MKRLFPPGMIYMFQHLCYFVFTREKHEKNPHEIEFCFQVEERC